MGFVSYSKALDEKIKGLGIIRLKKDIRLADGVIKAGSRLKRVNVDECNESGDECVLTVYGYREDFARRVRFKNFNIDDWFEAERNLTALDAQFRKVTEKIDSIEGYIEFVAFLVAVAMVVLGAVIGYKVANSSVGVIVGGSIGIVIALVACGVCGMAILHRYELERNELDEKINKIIASKADLQKKERSSNIMMYVPKANSKGE